MDQLRAAERTVGFGLVRTVYMTVGPTGSVIVGILSNHLGWLIAFGTLGAVMAAAVTLLVANSALAHEY